jgi:hypothetical protein
MIHDTISRRCLSSVYHGRSMLHIAIGMCLCYRYLNVNKTHDTLSCSYSTGLYGALPAVMVCVVHLHYNVARHNIPSDSNAKQARSGNFMLLCMYVVLFCIEDCCPVDLFLIAMCCTM